MSPADFHNIASFVQAACLQSPESPLFISREGAITTRAGFMAWVGMRRRQFDGQIGAGDAILVASRRGIAFFVDLVALWSIGAVGVPYNGDSSPDELQQLKVLTRAHIALQDVSDEVSPANQQPFPDRQDKLASILVTSGSMGKPKGCLLSHYAIIGNALASLAAIGYNPADRLLINIPFHFTSAICHFLAVTLSGGALIGIEERLLPADLMSAVKERNANAFAGAPLQLRWLANASPGMLPILSWVMSSGDHLPPEVIGLLRKAMPATRIHTVYGLTELGGRFCTLAPELIDLFPGSVGKPIAGLSCTIREPETGVPLATGETGEIFAHGEYSFKGYFENPAETAKALTRWGVRTGDLGYITSDGMLYVAGRIDDIFKVNGLKVSSAVIEQALMQTGQFEDVAVIPQELPLMGIVPVAYYAIKPNVVFNKAEILRQINGLLPSNYIPASFILRDVIARTSSGKIMRRLLVDPPKQ